MTQTNATNAANPATGKRRRPNSHYALSVAIIMAVMYGFFEGYKTFGSGSHKINPCVALKKREATVNAWKQELIANKSKSTDKDSIGKYYDREIDIAEGHLENINDSLKRLLCTE